MSSLKVKVEYLGYIGNTLGLQREEIKIVKGASIADLLLTLSEKHGAPFKKSIYEYGSLDVKSNFIVTVNGYLLNQLNGVETKLKDGDQVILMPLISGG